MFSGCMSCSMYTLLRAAVPVRFVTAGCKPAKQERHTKSTNVHAERLSLLTIFMCIFCGPHLPKVGTWQFLNVLKCKSSSRYSLVQMLPAWSSKSAPRLSLFYPFWKHWVCATVLCAFCRQLSQIEPRTRGNRGPTSATPGATLQY